MGKYRVTAGQNIYDVAMHLHGSVEGIVDLLINNPDLSLDDNLQSGNELDYTDDFTISPDIVAYNRMYSLLPANGERNVYYKDPSGKRIMELFLENKWTAAMLLINGNGMLEIDWGDNTEIEQLTLTGEVKELQHYFNDRIASKRKICLYGDVSFRTLDISHSHASEVYLLHPVSLEKFIYGKMEADISFLSLAEDTYELTLTGLQTDSLLPILPLKRLMRLDLSGARINPSVLDTYLIALVEKYYGRRDMTTILSTVPTGNYRQPEKDSNRNYMITSGMEAIWILTHEPAWNEGGAWTFIINQTIYTYEPDDTGNL